MKHVIKIVFSGLYVSHYDPHYKVHGRIETTGDIKQAVMFNSVGEALNAWPQINRNSPTRDDGLPNRPLTAFSIELVKVKEPEDAP